ncbi:amidase [Rhodoferax sp. AJA081-3]|uniref:amidase n=1 Tax=Rhodoferax sp. AJA081-3 TaxID=2752316 RepID=UPI001FD80C99|nr:amidase [Rhodoferax sp. AJA081-3]
MTYASIEATLKALDSGEMDSTTLVANQLARVESLDTKLHAYVDVYREEALQVARGLDKLRQAGHTIGPLHGVTLAIKDLFEIEGRPITGGSRSLPPRTSLITATVIKRLKAAGAIILGKTHTVEFAFGGWGTNTTMGTPWNPWDMAVHRIPGGSSSGSAVAVAAGMACAALGTDTGGSVRIPAGLCGLVGLKTTHGLISRYGLIDLCPTHDTVGTLTRTVRDSATLLDVLAGADPRDKESSISPSRSVSKDLEKEVRGMRVWVLPDAERCDVDPEVLDAYDRSLVVLQGLGMRLVDKPLPQSLSQSMRVAGSLMSAEGYANLGTLFERDGLEFDPNIKRRILLGRDIRAAQYIDLLQEREVAKALMAEAMDGIDVCVFPTNAITAIPVSEVDELATPLSRLGRFVNLLDLCSVAVPAGLSSGGLPISIQIIGRAFAEPTILRAAFAFEKATSWGLAHPSGLDHLGSVAQAT